MVGSCARHGHQNFLRGAATNFHGGCTRTCTHSHAMPIFQPAAHHQRVFRCNFNSNRLPIRTPFAKARSAPFGIRPCQPPPCKITKMAVYGCDGKQLGPDIRAAIGLANYQRRMHSGLKSHEIGQVVVHKSYCLEMRYRLGLGISSWRRTTSRQHPLDREAKFAKVTQTRIFELWFQCRDTHQGVAIIVQRKACLQSRLDCGNGRPEALVETCMQLRQQCSL